MVSYHDAQVTFFKEPNRKAVEEKIESYKNLIGSSVFSTITEKTGRISSIKTIGNNVFFRVEVD